MKGTLPSKSGKLIKGYIKDTSSKLAIGSIPSNYQTIINNVTYQKAFNSSSPRNLLTNVKVKGQQGKEREQSRQFLYSMSNLNLQNTAKSLKKSENSKNSCFKSTYDRTYQNSNVKSNMNTIQDFYKNKDNTQSIESLIQKSKTSQGGRKNQFFNQQYHVKEVNQMRDSFYSSIQRQRQKLKSNSKRKLNSSDCDSPSHSKKGYGTLISKQQRNFLKSINNGKKIGGPGPGAYETNQKAIQKKNKSIQKEISLSPNKFKSKSRNSVYYKKIKELICQVNILEKSISPGPGQYFKTQKTQEGYINSSPKNKSKTQEKFFKQYSPVRKFDQKKEKNLSNQLQEQQANNYEEQQNLFQKIQPKTQKLQLQLNDCSNNEDFNQNQNNFSYKQKRYCGSNPKTSQAYKRNQFLKKNHKGWQCSFNTKVNRNAYLKREQVPGPGQYQLQGEDMKYKADKKNNMDIRMKNDKKSLNILKEQDINLLKDKHQRLKMFQNQTFYQNPTLNKKNYNISIPMKTSPSKNNQKYQKLMKSVFNKQYHTLKQTIENRNAIPGPGAYEHKIPQMKPFYEKIKNSNNFIQGQIDRFGQFIGQTYREVNFLLDQPEQILDPYKKKQNLKGLDPGMYNIKSAFQKAQKKRLIQTSSFMSQSKRDLFNQSQKKYGPNLSNINEQFYNSQYGKQIISGIINSRNKKNFNLNIFNVWH